MKEKIGTVQATLLIVSTILPTALIVLPVIIGKYLEQDSPISVVITGFVGAAIAWLIGSVAKRNNGEPFLDWVKGITSPVVAFIIGILLLQYYMDTTVAILREYVNFIRDNVLLNTPDAVLTVIIMLVALYMADKGIVAISRINSIATLLITIIVPLYIGGLIKHFSLPRLLPMFDHSAASLALATLTPAGWMSEVGILLFLSPYLRHPGKATRINIIGSSIVSGILLVDILTTLLVLGPQYIQSVSYPIFSTVSIIQVGRYIENLDILFTSFWIMNVYMKLAIFTFVTVQCFKQTFRIQNERPYSVALSLIAIVECLYTWADPGKIDTYNQQGRMLVFLLLNVLLPLGILLWVRVKDQHSVKKGAQT
ncbi:endospore germination permease [Paenibacillus sp. HN-1]|uniref:GerAB/ArcD/ProY family transporter n=1 Tax=Paenibacillus TaxID=44249 RepID=UPI001CAA118E|nr:MULTISPECIES: endospore germination permease [Paenibacillus]MBY9081155.1 endospore germination permease [Paenibacillus sp. CGMCC 1.18879]MBY9087192.1 endospore germination permease [Paenibacillus sinensis]